MDFFSEHILNTCTHPFLDPLNPHSHSYVKSATKLNKMHRCTTCYILRYLSKSYGRDRILYIETIIFSDFKHLSDLLFDHNYSTVLHLLYLFSIDTFKIVVSRQIGRFQIELLTYLYINFI